MGLKASTLREAGFLTMMSSSSVKRFFPRLTVTFAWALIEWIRRFLACTRWRRSADARISLGTLLGHSDAHPERSEAEKRSKATVQRGPLKDVCPFLP